VGSKNQRFVAELRYVVSYYVMNLYELLKLIFLAFFDTLQNYVNSWQNMIINKKYIWQFSDNFLIFGAYSRDYENYNKIILYSLCTVNNGSSGIYVNILIILLEVRRRSKFIWRLLFFCKSVCVWINSLRNFLNSLHPSMGLWAGVTSFH